MDYAIEVKNFTKVFGYKTAVNNASFQVKEGSIHGLVGPNGAGKSTILNALLGLLFASRGELLIEGKKVITDPTFSANVGYVPAEPLFPRHMKVKQFVEFVAHLRDIPISQVSQTLNASFLNKLSYQKCITLSTGQKKLLQLFVISLYLNKKSKTSVNKDSRRPILLLDEPFNGLDPTKRILLAKEIKKVKNQGGTILMSTHILSDLQELADEITMIKPGKNGSKVVYSGPKTKDIQKTYEQYFVQGGSGDDLFA